MPPGPPRRGPNRWVWLIVLVPIGVVVVGFLAVFVLFAGISSGPRPPSGTVLSNEVFTAKAAGDTTVYSVTVRSPDGVGDDAEGHVVLKTESYLRGAESLQVSVTAQGPQATSKRFTSVGRDEGTGSKSFRRSAHLSDFVACSGCEYRFEIAVTAAGGPITTGIVFEGSTFGKGVPSGLPATTAVVTARHSIEGSAAKRVALDRAASVGTEFRVWHVRLTGVGRALDQTQVRVVPAGDLDPAPALGMFGPSVTRADVQAPASHTDAGSPEVRVAGLHGVLPLASEGCAADCTIGLWVVAADNTALELELRGQGEGVRAELVTVQRKVVEEAISVDAGDSTARKVLALAADGGPSSGIQAIVTARLSLEGPGVALGRLGTERLEVGNVEHQSKLVTGPCVAEGCNAATPLTLTGSAAATVRLTAEAFFVGSGDAALSDVVSLTLR